MISIALELAGLRRRDLELGLHSALGALELFMGLLQLAVEALHGGLENGRALLERFVEPQTFREPNKENDPNVGS